MSQEKLLLAESYPCSPTSWCNQARGCTLFSKEPRNVSQLTLYWQQQQTWFLLFCFAFQGKRRSSEAPLLWRDARELSSSVSQMLYARQAWKLLFPHVLIFLAGSRVSSPSRFSEKTQVRLVGRAAAGAVCWGPLCVRVWSPPAGWLRRCSRL